MRPRFTALSKPSLIPGTSGDFRLPPLNIQQIINHMRSSGCGRSSYVNASMREEVPSVARSARHLNDDKCAARSGNIESYRDIYQVTFEQHKREPFVSGRRSRCMFCLCPSPLSVATHQGDQDLGFRFGFHAVVFTSL